MDDPVMSSPYENENDGESCGKTSWFIGLILVLTFLFVINFLIWIVKWMWNRGEKYSVYENEMANGHMDDDDDDEGFVDDSQQLYRAECIKLDVLTSASASRVNEEEEKSN